jgi:hypothetical protein
VILPFGDAHARAYQEKIDFRKVKLDIYRIHIYPALRSKYIVGYIFNSVGLIITRESPCIGQK